MRQLTTTEKARLADQLIDAIHQPSLKHYCEDIYGPCAHHVQVQVHRLTNGSLLSLRVLVWNEDDEYLYPDLTLPYWKKVKRETDTFEREMTEEQKLLAAEAYLLMCQVPQEYGIAPIQTEEIILHEIKSLEEIALYIDDGLPVTTLHLSYVEGKEELVYAGDCLA